MARFSFVGRFIKWIVRTVLIVLFLAGWALALLAVHVVVVPHGEASTDASTDASTEGEIGWRVVVVPKNRLGVSDTYVDTRGWTDADVREHEALVARIVEAGKGDRLSHVIEGAIRGSLEDLALQRARLLGSGEQE